jgi:hypothetical protein
MRSTVSACILAVGAVIPMHVPRADACSEQEPGVLGREVLPSGGAAVPTNTRVLVRYSVLEWFELPETFAIRGEDGVAVEVDVEQTKERAVTRVLVTPRQPLAPRTRYRVFDRIVLEDECSFADRAPCVGDEVEIAAFTTGDGPDEAAPVARGATVATTYTPAQECAERAAVGHAATFREISDEQPIDTLRFNVYAPDGRRIRAYDERAALGHSCPAYDHEDDTDDFTVRVVDLAGNEGPPNELSGRRCDDFAGGCDAGGSGAGVLVGLAGLLALRRR